MFHSASRLLSKYVRLTLFFLIFLSCSRNTKLPPQQAEVWKKLSFDIWQLDGLGIAKSGTTIDYEFCIPDTDQHKAEALTADPSVRIQGGRGRIGCGKGELLCIGSTNGKDYKERLYRLCSLPWVKKIDQTFWE